MRLARYPDAIAAFDEALRRQPDYYEARGNRAAAFLTLGDFERGMGGFPKNRCDTATDSHPGVPSSSDGRATRRADHPPPPRSGAGRYDPVHPILRRCSGAGACVVVACQEPLVRLAETCPGIDRVITQGDPLPEFDVHSTLTRVMCLITRSVDAIPAPIPAFRADPGRAGRWRDRLSGCPGFRVGIAWQGNPEHSRDRDRSFPLALFERLAGIEGVRLISLQRGAWDRAAPRARWTLPRHRPGDEVDPGMAMMEDTPAIIMGLDLVIAPDTAVAHLAGGPGSPDRARTAAGPRLALDARSSG